MGKKKKLCLNHEDVPATGTCALCAESFCAKCLKRTPDGACCRECARSAGPSREAPKKQGPSVVLIVAIVGGVFLVLVAIGAAIAIPAALEERKRGNEASAVGALKTIATAEAIFHEGDKEQDGNLDYGTLEELERARLVDPILGSGTKMGYTFTASYSPTTAEFLWYATASPAVPGTTGDRYFYINQAGVIFYSKEPLGVDPKTCVLPVAGMVPVGR